MLHNCTKFNLMVLWVKLNNLFHAFKVYGLGLILLKNVGTFTKVNN
jgi:hypothetical protein